MLKLFLLPALAVLPVVGGCVRYHAAPLLPDRELQGLRTRDLSFYLSRQAESPSRSPSVAAVDFTNGLNEAEVVAVALVLNPELQAKRSAIGEVTSALIAAGQWPNPEIGLGLRPGISGASGTAIEASALFQLMLPAERDARKQAAGAQIEMVKAELLADESRVVADVRQQRLAVLATERGVALLEEAADLRRRAFDVVKRQRELGEANELDASAAELELAESRRNLRQARVGFEIEKQQLHRLMGLPPTDDLRLEELGEPLAIVVLEDVGDDELDRRLLSGRPELRAKEASYQKSEQELRLAILRQYPRVSVGPGFAREVEGVQSIGAAVTLELPLLNQNQGEIAEKTFARESARANFLAALHKLRADAFAARAAVRTAQADVVSQEQDILPLLRKSQELFAGAFKAREVNIVDWITAQQRALNSRREYLDSLVRYRKAVIRLESVTGPPRDGVSSVQTTQPTKP